MTTSALPQGVRGNKKGKDHQLRTVSEIRKLLLSKTDYEIMEILGIPNSTYYRYKSKINKQDDELWQKISLESLQTGVINIMTALKQLYTINKEIAEDIKAPAKDRIIASQNMVKAQVNIFYLLKKGKGLSNPNHPITLKDL